MESYRIPDSIIVEGRICSMVLMFCVGDFSAVGTVQDVSSTIAPCHW